jgi:hypothetical protein
MKDQLGCQRSALSLNRRHYIYNSSGIFSQSENIFSRHTVHTEFLNFPVDNRTLTYSTAENNIDLNLS